MTTIANAPHDVTRALPAVTRALPAVTPAPLAVTPAPLAVIPAPLAVIPAKAGIQSVPAALRTLLRFMACLLTLLALQPAAHAQAYPNRTIRFIVAYPPGGATDVFARMIAERISPSLGQTVVVENRPGASGMLGAGSVASAAPDGYTVLICGAGEAVVNPSIYKGVRYDPLKDLTPITMVAMAPMVLAAHPNAPAKSVAEIVGHAKGGKEKVAFASPGIATPNHFAAELLGNEAGVRFLNVPYKGGADAMNDLLSGQVPYSFLAIATAAQQIKAGRIRVVAVASSRRWPGLPEVPTIAESGYANFDLSSWVGAMVPGNTPREIVDRLNTEITRVLRQPDVQEKFLERGALPSPGTPEAMRTLMTHEIARYKRLAASAGIELQSN